MTDTPQLYGFIPWEGYEFPPETMVGETVFDSGGEAVGWIVNPDFQSTCHADETETIYASRYDANGWTNYHIHVMECSACGRTYEHVNGDYEYCPHCGRRINEEDE